MTSPSDAIPMPAGTGNYLLDYDEVSIVIIALMTYQSQFQPDNPENEPILITIQSIIDRLS